VELAAAAYIRIEVFDLLGRRVALALDQELPAGTHPVSFDASGLPSGTYLYMAQTGGGWASRLMTTVR
jgi:hypothetical protein